MTALPEMEAAERIGQVIFKHLDAHGTFTDQFKREVGQKCVAHRGFIASVFRDLDNDPGTVPNDYIKLRQQPVNETESLDWFIEEAHYHRKAYEEAVEMVDRLTAARLAEHDPDEAGARDDERRLSQERRDFAATDAAPRWQAS